MDAEEKLLREWEMRYKSYMSYRTQYLSTLTISGTLYVLVFREIIGTSGVNNKLIMIFVLFLIVALLFFAHLVGITTIKTLGKKIIDLQKKLEFENFETTKPLETALRISLIFTVLGGIVLVFYGLLITIYN